jgi:hypothetical protein
MLLAPRGREDEIVALAAAFLGLNAIVADSVTVPADSAEHDQIAATFPPLRARVLQDAYRAPNGEQELKLIDDLRLVSAIGGLFDLALTRDFAFAYQLNACRREGDTRALSWARHNLVRVEELDLPQPVLLSQRSAVARMEKAAFLIEEFVGCDKVAVMRRIRDAADAAVQAMQRPQAFPDDLLRVGPGGMLDNQLLIGRHTARVEPFAPWQAAAAAASRNEALDVLAWHPPPGLAHLIGNVARGAESEADYLRRIEERLAAIERELATRHGGMQRSECEDFKKALQHARIEPTHALGNARMILDGIIGTIYRQHCKGKEGKPLFNMIEELIEGTTGSIFPKAIKTYLHTVRVLGNIVVHRTGDVDTVDIEITLLALLQIVAWYVLEYRPPALA